VQIYRHGEHCSFTGQQLGVDPQSLQQTASHRLWRNGVPSFVDVAGQAVAVLIPTVQGEKRIDLRNAPIATSERCDHVAL
jgi:hypothetical protein